MSSQSFQSTLTITHIHTACSILSIDGINFLTDPFFSPAGTQFPLPGAVLTNSSGPALNLSDLPPIDAILLSHEDHPDNLDDLGRQLLDGRHVFTTQDGAKNLAPRPGARGMAPWETRSISLGGKEWKITATPCQHLPGGECVGFIFSTASFGTAEDGRPNAIWFTGDTVYFDELAKIPEKFHIIVAIMNLGAARAGPLQITMDGKQAAHLFRVLGAGYLVPMHYESWNHFTEGGEDLKRVFGEEGVLGRVRWLTAGHAVGII